MRKRCSIIILFLVSLTFVFSDRAQASHAMGADITYTCTGPNTYEVTLTFYRDCDGISAPSGPITLDAESANCNATTSATLTQQTPSSYCNQGVINNNGECEISGVCNNQLSNTTCNGGTLPGVEQYEYTGTLTLPQQCSDWIISYSVCCRNSAITNLQNPGSQDMYVYATINNSGGLCNNSPFFSEPPVPYICDQKPINYNHGAIDVDGDSLVYSLIDPLDDFNTPINHVNPYSASYPLSTVSGSFPFDSTTGQMNFVPDGQQNAVVTVLVEEYRNGQLVGTTMRDIQVVSISNPNICTNDPPNFAHITDTSGTGGSVIDSNSVVTCPNAPVDFSLTFTDPNSDTLNVSTNINQSIPDANFNIVNNNDTTVTANFNWTPDTGDAYQNSFQVTVGDNGCPVSASQTFTYDIFVFPDLRIPEDTIVYCGDSVQLNAIGGTEFNWTPSAGLSNDTIANPVAAPSSPRWYYVTSDCGSDSVFVDKQPGFTLDAGPDTSICFNGQVQLDATADISQAPYSWSWSPSDGLSNDSIPDPFAAPSDTTEYQLTAISDNGCVRKDSLTVEVTGIAPSVTAYVDEDTVCPGATVNLDISTAPKTCGLSNQPCNTQSNQYTVGTGTNSTGQGTPYEGWWEDGRVIMLYRASELNAMGLTGGKITEIAFNVASKLSTQPYSNFTIKMGCTNQSSLNNFISGLDVVYGPKSVSTTSGWNTHILDTPYDWDGNSNLLVEVCFDNGSYTDEDEVFYTSTTYNSVVYDNADASVGCTLTSATTSTERPNIRFETCQEGIGNNATVSWSPSALVDSPNVATTTATVPQDTTFTVEVDDGNGCIGSDFVNVDVNNTLSVDAGNDVSICSQQSAQLNVTANGNPPPIDLNCGENGTPCPDSSTSVNTFGSGSNVTGQPSPYRGGTKARMQFIYQENELKSQGIDEGVISALAFDVATKNSTAPYEFMNIKMGCTNRDTMSQSAGYASNLQLVYSDSSYSTSTGWNTHEFDSTFDWDGSSNLIIEVCYANPNGTSSGGGGNSDLINTTTTAYTSSIFTDDNFANGPGCSLTYTNLVTQLSSTRPNLQFHMCPPPPGEFIVDWTPTNGLSDSTVLDPLANPDTATTYTVNVSDVNGCSATDVVTVDTGCTVNANLTVQYLSCQGGSNNGTAWVDPADGDPPYSVLWSDSSTTDTITNLSPGSYSVTVTDTNGVSDVDSFTLDQPVDVVIDSFTTQDVLCNGDSSGSATVHASGGTTGLLYDWSNDDTTQTATNLPEGTHTVIVSDSLGCADTSSVTITEPSAINLTVGADSTSCFNGNDGIAYVSVTGGTSPYSYVWDSGVSNLDTATGLSPGQHTVFVTDSAGCVDSASVVVDEPPRIDFLTDSTSTSCGGYSDGSATVTPTTGTSPYSYQWSNGDTTQTADSLSSGYHSFTFTDADGCSVVDSVFVPQPSPIVFDVDSMDISCHGADDGMAWVSNISGGTSPYTVDWSNNSSTDTISGLSAGSYTVSVTDDSGCVMMDTVFIDEPDTLTITFVDSTNVSCNGGSDGSSMFEVTGGTKPYLVQSNATSNDSMITNLSAGTYSVDVIDNNGCVDSANVTISEPSALTSNIDTVIDVACYGDSTGSVTVSANGGTPPYNYSWNDADSQNTATASGLPAGTFNVTITDDSGCVTIDTATVMQPDSFQVDFTVVEPVSCYGASDAVVLASIGGDTTKHTFVWADDTGALNSGLDAGNHVVTVTTDSTGCQQTANITLSQPDSISLSTSSTPVSCNGGSDGSATATASGGNGSPYVYIWSTNDTAQTITGLTAGTYDVTAVDTNGCSESSTVTVNEPAPLQLNTTTTAVSCSGGSDGEATVTVTGGTSPYSYSWNDASGQTSSTADSLEAGNYTVTVTDDNGCENTASVTVNQPEGISLKETDVIDESCPDAEDGAVFVKAEGGTSPYEYALEGEGNSSEGSFNGLEGGRDYNLTISDGNNCDKDTTINIGRPDELVIDFEKDRVTVELGQGKRLNPIIFPEDSGAYSYMWEPSTGLSCVDCQRPVTNPYDETVYELTVYDENGCRYSETITVDVANPEVLYVPNAFTPDGDERNDEFRIYGKAINKIDLKIFDRWGEKMFETKNVNEGWDGTLPSGKDAPTGVYVYSVIIQYIDGTTKEKQGSVTLIR